MCSFSFPSMLMTVYRGENLRRLSAFHPHRPYNEENHRKAQECGLLDFFLSSVYSCVVWGKASMRERDQLEHQRNPCSTGRREQQTLTFSPWANVLLGIDAIRSNHEVAPSGRANLCGNCPQ